MKHLIFLVAAALPGLIAGYAPDEQSKSGDLTEAGRWADLTVMDIDPFVLCEDSPGDILNGRILMTIVNGKVAYER